MQPTFQLQNCPIFLGPLAQSLPHWLQQQQYSRVFVLTDEHTRQACMPLLLPLLPALWEETTVPAGETFKNIATCDNIWQQMLKANLDRQALVINLGGGVIGDMGGFCAATWKRGVDFVQIPTTLLSMTDAAIGGKMGVDFQGLKNTIGVFKQPAAIFVDPAFLQTLPLRELQSGYAEVLKHALIGQNLPSTLSFPKHSAEQWQDILHQSIAVKVQVVQEDPYEKGLRMLLNFGHTIGHALESYFLDSPHTLTHGEAIYIGMICEAHHLMAQQSDLLEKVLKLGQGIFNHHNIPPAAFPAIWEHMQHDKKNSSGTVRMAVPDEKPYSLKIIEPSSTTLIQSLVYYNTLR